MNSILYKKILLSIISIILGILFFNKEVFSQNINFHNFSTKNGLPSTQVYNMYQDSFGVIWFATDRGICNYNSYEFEQFGLEDGLTSNTVFKFYPQEDGNIWCTTINNQIFYFNPEDRVFHPYQYNEILSKKAGDWDCKDLFIDKNKTIYFSFRQKNGFIAIDTTGTIHNSNTSYTEEKSPGIVIETYQNNQSFTYLEYTPIERPSQIKRYKLVKPDMSMDYYQGMVKDSFKIISSLNNVYVINKQRESKTISTGNRPITMGFLNERIFWVGYDFGGVTLYNLNGLQTQSFLEKESVTGVLIDHEGGFWISTLYSGVYYTKNIEDRNIILESNKNVHSLAIDQNGELLVSLSNGNVYQKTNESFKLWFQSSSLKPTICQYYSSINSMIYHGNNRIHFPNYNISSYVKKMPEDNNQPIYIPVRTTILQERNKSKVLSVPFKLRILDVCAKDSFLLISNREGLYKYNLEDDQCEKIEIEKINCAVSDIDQFSENTFLIATVGNGLGILKDDNLDMLTTENGLISNIIKEVYIQNDSIFWLCTNAGINRIIITKEDKYTISSYTTLDGLIDNDINDIEIIDGVVWVATNSGLSYFNANVIDEKNITNNYFLQVLNKRVNGNIIDDLSDLSNDQNKLEFTYQAISFKGNNDLKYRYRLVELNESWNFTTNLHVIYESVPPGEYVFELQAGINNRWVSESKKVNIVINPPFYKTFWFIATFILSGLLIIYLFFKYRILSYNREIIRELLRLFLKRLKKGSLDFIVRENGIDVKVNSLDVLYIKSLGNYIEFFTTKNVKIVVRNKMSNVKKLVPDPMEYLQVHRSFIVRLDKISKKGANSVFIDNTEIKVGETYRHLLPQISLV